MTRGKKYYTHIYTNYTKDMRMYLCKDAKTTMVTWQLHTAVLKI